MFKTNFETQELRPISYFEWGTKKSAPAGAKNSLRLTFFFFFLVRHPPKIENYLNITCLKNPNYPKKWPMVQIDVREHVKIGSAVHYVFGMGYEIAKPRGGGGGLKSWKKSATTVKILPPPPNSKCFKFCPPKILKVSAPVLQVIIFGRETKFFFEKRPPKSPSFEKKIDFWPIGSSSRYS